MSKDLSTFSLQNLARGAFMGSSLGCLVPALGWGPVAVFVMSGLLLGLDALLTARVTVAAEVQASFERERQARVGFQASTEAELTRLGHELQKVANTAGVKLKGRV